MQARELIRRALLRAPWPAAPLVERMYLARHEEVFRAEAVPGVFVELGAPKHSALWRQRFAQVGGHEPGVCRFLAEQLRPDEVFYDVGAHFGFYPALVSAVQPTAEVHCFEPALGLLQFLAGNRRRCSSGGRWRIVGRLVGAAPGRATVQLDDYARRQGRPPTLVKIDVEGAEVLVLRGCRELLAQGATEFLIELHPETMPQFGATAREFLDGLAGYRLQVLDDIRNPQAPVWSDDLSLALGDHQTYLYAAPPGRARC